jgi:hypothetical protein
MLEAVLAAVATAAISGMLLECARLALTPYGEGIPDVSMLTSMMNVIAAYAAPLMAMYLIWNLLGWWILLCLFSGIFLGKFIADFWIISSSRGGGSARNIALGTRVLPWVGMGLTFLTAALAGSAERALGI